MIRHERPRPAGRIASIAAMLLGLSACATGPYVAPLHSPAATAIGSGRYRYQLTLKDVDGKPQAHANFALSLQKRRLPFIADEKNVWRGTTDGEGRTPVFALPFRLPAKAVLLRGRVGDGPFGEQMRLMYGAHDPLAGIAYRLLVCTDPPQEFFGRTDSAGYTAYAATEQPVHVGVYADQGALSRSNDDHTQDNIAFCKDPPRNGR